ncbi:MAG: hypothetical protein K940chlam8_00216 [Chlamydiae bacterium]|nr:hypothetical protein [Chlamydiota bacterium]
MPKLSVLAVTPFFPFPEYKDGIRKILANLLKTNDYYTMDVLCLNDEEDIAYAHIHSKNWEHANIDTIRFQQGRLQKKIKMLRWLFSIYPWQAYRYQSLFPTIAKNIMERESKYDIIHIFTPSFIPLLRYLPEDIHKKVIFSSIDSFSLLFSRRLGLEKATSIREKIKQLAYKIELKKIEKLEKETFHQPLCTLFVSPTDTQHVQRSNPKAKLKTIPNGVDISYFLRPKNKQRKPKNLLFVGNFGYAPNLDAISFLCHEVMPILYKKDPSIHLTIIGIGLEKHHFTPQPNVTILGFVEDLRPYYHESALFVCPLRFGSGIKNKVLEAMVASLPVIGFSCAFEGICGNNHEHFICTDNCDATSYSQCIIEALDIPQKMEKMGLKSHHLINEKYSWDEVQKQYSDVYNVSKGIA